MVSPESFTVITRTPIPAALPPGAVLAALHTFEALIKPNPYLDHFEQRALTPDEAAGTDPFFPPAAELYGYVIHDRVPVIPGVGSWATLKVAVPCVFQRFSHGVRCCAHAQGGVVVRSSYEVRRRGEVTAQGVGAWVGEGGRGTAGGRDDGEYELVDISNIECGALVKPFVKMRFSSAHQALLEQVIQNLLRAGGQAGGGTW